MPILSVFANVTNSYALKVDFKIIFTKDQTYYIPFTKKGNDGGEGIAYR